MGQVNFCKYKTELCKTFTELGYCPYKGKCQFAHGSSELKSNLEIEKKHYRTKKCKYFWETGTCSYGSRCQFLHNRPTPQKETQFLKLAKIILFAKESSSSQLTTILPRNGQTLSKWPLHYLYFYFIILRILENFWF